MSDNDRIFNESESGVIVRPARRLFLGSLVAGSAVGLSGCSLLDMLGMGDFATTKTSSNSKGGFLGDHDKRGTIVAGRSKKSGSRRRVQNKRKNLSLDRYDERSLAFHNTHTGERLKVTYWEDGNYVSGALREINHLMRDHRRNETHKMDPRLMDQLFVLRKKLDTSRPFHIISGYRSPKTNALLREKGRGVAKRSFHMTGRAIDIRVPGKALSQVRLAALSMRAGGVGYYPGPQFVHVDTGRVRRW